MKNSILEWKISEDYNKYYRTVISELSLEKKWKFQQTKIGNRKKQRRSINEIIHRMVFITFNKIKQMQGTNHPKRREEHKGRRRGPWGLSTQRLRSKRHQVEFIFLEGDEQEGWSRNMTGLEYHVKECVQEGLYIVLSVQWSLNYRLWNLEVPWSEKNRLRQSLKSTGEGGSEVRIMQ